MGVFSPDREINAWAGKDKKMILCLYLQNIQFNFVLDKPLLITSRAEGNAKERLKRKI